MKLNKKQKTVLEVASHLAATTSMDQFQISDEIYYNHNINVWHDDVCVDILRKAVSGR